MSGALRSQDSGVFFHDSVATPLGRVTMAGHHRSGGGIPQWRTLRNYALVLPLQGTATLETGASASFTVKKGDLFWIFPRIKHRYRPDPTAAWEEFWILFDGPIFSTWRGTLLDSRHPVISLGETAFWISRLRWSLFANNERTPLQAITRVARLNLVMSEIWQYLQRSNLSAADQNWLKSAQTALQRSIESAVPLPEVARALRCGYDVFRRRFRLLAGISPSQYRHRLKLDTCAELLLYDRYTNKELAERFHFSSEFHFSREFTRHIGISPRAFSKMRG